MENASTRMKLLYSTFAIPVIAVVVSLTIMGISSM